MEDSIRDIWNYTFQGTALNKYTLIKTMATRRMHCSAAQSKSEQLQLNLLWTAAKQSLIKWIGFFYIPTESATVICSLLLIILRQISDLLQFSCPGRSSLASVLEGYSRAGFLLLLERFLEKFVADPLRGSGTIKRIVLPSFPNFKSSS